ncbi:putative metal-dependent hydrolase YjjV [Methylophilaceae bacterium]|nr:putative metal-dependent hydrolase YjjV [Methylophilaceae bacterium]
MLIDTHCHLDAAEFDPDRQAVAQSALQQGVGMIVVPAVHRGNFEHVQGLAGEYAHCACALGIHPLYVQDAQPQDLDVLKSLLESGQAVAVGEIGLDFFVEGYDRERQEYFFIEQLKLAKALDLPVILHVRRSIDIILKHLRKFKPRGGIAHAFNGSAQQANEFIKLGFKLGFGGAMTYPRALRIRQLAHDLPLEAIVLETDAPDIPPEWVGSHGRNSPGQLAGIARVFAEIRGLDVRQVAEITTNNALAALPKLAHLCTPPKVLH